MGGVDLLDRILAKYETKKWTIKAMDHFVDFAIAAARIEYRTVAAESGWSKKYILSYYFLKLDIAKNLILFFKRTF